MCGFLVYFPIKNSKKFKKNKFLKAGKLISHRGPDDYKVFLNEKINMAFYRLSIIDASKNGSQPMISNSKNNLIVFNGEIYNSSELKSQFNEKIFRGKSDTEVLLNLYEKYGSQCLKYLKGMYSFVIYNFKNHSCFVARDRFGIKPLYYTQNKDYILFSSEIKPILLYEENNSPNQRCFADFLIHQELDAKETFFKGINPILPSTFKIFKKENIITNKYWDLFDKNKKKESYSIVKDKFSDYLKKAINRNLVSDRKLGLSLSGGNDSEIIANQVRKSNTNLETVTYGFENSNINETAKAEKISKLNEFKNHQVFVNSDYIIKNFQKVINELESPFTSIRIFGTRKVFEKFKSLKIPVALEGIGGDEMLGGYDHNIISYFKDIAKNKFEFMNKLKTLSSKRKVKIIEYIKTFNYQNHSTKDCTQFFDKSNLNKDFYHKYKNKKKYFVLKKFSELNFMKKSQFIDINFTYLPRSLKYSDRLSMNNGVEARPLFLDHELFKYCFNLDNEFKINNLKTRYLMRDMINQRREYYLKKTITDPQRKLLLTTLKEFTNDNFHSRSFKENNFFNYKNVIKNFNNKIIVEKNSYQFFQILTTHLMTENFKLR